MAKKGQSPETFSVDAPSLLGFAARLEYVAKRYREIAAKIPAGKHIQVTGLPTAEKSERLLVGWMASLQGGLDDLAMLEASGIKQVAAKAAKDAKTPAKNH